MSNPNSSRRSSRHDFGFWAVAFSFLAVMAFSTVPTPLYVLYQAKEHFSSFTITLIFSAYAVGVVISLFLVGHISDWHGRRKVFLPALLLSAISAVIFLVWSSVAGLFVARFINGLAVGAVTATATAWLLELHTARSDKGGRMAQIVATTANIGGLGFGALVSGLLAEFIGNPLHVPYEIFLAVFVVAIAVTLASPETKELPNPRPRYRPQRVSIPKADVNRFMAAAGGALVTFALFGLFTSLAPSFLGGSLHHPSRALAGFTAFIVFAASVSAQVSTPTWPVRRLLIAGMISIAVGMTLVVLGVWLPSPSLALFMIGGVVIGAGGGFMFKGTLTTVISIASDDNRAEVLAGLFLAGYIGIAVPVIGLGILTQFISAKSALLVFVVVLAAGIGAIGPKLLAKEPAR